mmetsp:Transcript_60729/g.159701  ORF Transcript_60729/g.159701 Transcript_60729/m.159701 type:complete len:368 (+) Transcript_60729:300-1403(+)
MGGQRDRGGKTSPLPGVCHVAGAELRTPRPARWSRGRLGRSGLQRRVPEPEHQLLGREEHGLVRERGRGCRERQPDGEKVADRQPHQDAVSDSMAGAGLRRGRQDAADDRAGVLQGAEKPRRTRCRRSRTLGAGVVRRPRDVRPGDDVVDVADRPLRELLLLRGGHLGLVLTRHGEQVVPARVVGLAGESRAAQQREAPDRRQQLRRLHRSIARGPVPRRDGPPHRGVQLSGPRASRSDGSGRELGGRHDSGDVPRDPPALQQLLVGRPVEQRVQRHGHLLQPLRIHPQPRRPQRDRDPRGRQLQPDGRHPGDLRGCHALVAVGQRHQLAGGDGRRGERVPGLPDPGTGECDRHRRGRKEGAAAQLP